ncbi:MAG TPA: hypothetical protein ENI87_13055 [bacterium]|nr:hypothetical protein [bacterium]
MVTARDLRIARIPAVGIAAVATLDDAAVAVDTPDHAGRSAASEVLRSADAEHQRAPQQDQEFAATEHGTVDLRRIGAMLLPA